MPASPTHRVCRLEGDPHGSVEHRLGSPHARQHPRQRFQYLQLAKTAFSEWSEHKATKLAAALAFYTMLSIAPLLIISIKIVATVTHNSDAAKSAIHNYLGANASPKAADAADEMIDSAGGKSKKTDDAEKAANAGGQTAIQDKGAEEAKKKTGTIATVISLIVLILSASGVFGELQDSLNTIFEVKPKPNRGILGIIRDRFFSMTLVLGTAFLLLVSLVASTVLTGLAKRIGGEGFVMEALNFVVSFGVTALLFSLIFKYLPDVRLHWRNVFIGGALTAVMFTIGKFLLGWYLGRGTTTSVYGAAGSLVAMLIWVYYSAWFLFFGAEFTRAYALAHGDGKQPEANAVKVTEDDKAKQGRPSEERVAAKAAQAAGRPVRKRVPPAAIPAYSMAPATEPPSALRQAAIAGAGAVIAHSPARSVPPRWPGKPSTPSASTSPPSASTAPQKRRTPRRQDLPHPAIPAGRDCLRPHQRSGQAHPPRPRRPPRRTKPPPELARPCRRRDRRE